MKLTNTKTEAPGSVITGVDPRLFNRRFKISEWGSNLSSYPKYSNRKVRANNTDQDQMLQNAVSIQGLYCLPLIK